MAGRSQVPVGEPDRPGELGRVSQARGLVVFAHANGYSRTSRRSKEIVRRLQSRRLNTLLLDLLTAAEAEDGAKALDIELLTQRVLLALDALPPDLLDLPIGLLGSGSGAAAALVAQTRRPRSVTALVLRSARVDLAGSAIAEVSAPTLLIVGGADAEVLELNRRAFAGLRCEKRIEIVPRATHLFLEAGALDFVAQRAGDWFTQHLQPPE